MTLSELYNRFLITRLPDTRHFPVIPSPVIPAQANMKKCNLWPLVTCFYRGAIIAP